VRNRFALATQIRLIILSLKKRTHFFVIYAKIAKLYQLTNYKHAKLTGFALISWKWYFSEEICKKLVELLLARFYTGLPN
jgi:hypothetical protein